MSISALVVTLAVGYGQPIDHRQVACLAETVYFESSNQPIDGQVAVALTVMNRVGLSRYPNTICEVVYQPKQFSYTSIPIETRNELIKNANPIDKIAQELAVRIALQAASGGFDGMHHSHHYYNPDKASPSWAVSFDNSMTIGQHRWVW